MKYVIFDIDGCISDDRWRHQLVSDHPDPDTKYGEYNARHADDAPMNIDALQLHLDAAHTVLFITARPELHRASTVQWLAKHIRWDGIPFHLLMRPKGNHWHSPALKAGMLLGLLGARMEQISDVAAAYDDRIDVLATYATLGIKEVHVLDHDGRHDACPTPAVPGDVPSILQGMADTYRERNNVYGDNYKRVGAVLAAMFPDGIVLRTAEDFNRWHLFELKIVKLTRFAVSGLTHQDSIHDDAVYSAMVESLIDHTTTPIQGEKQ